MVLSGEFGNTAFCTLKLKPLKPGTLILEAIFVLQCSAPSELQLQRHLPLTTLRLVVDSNNNDLSKVLTTTHFEKLGKKVARRSAQDLVRHARPQITAMVELAEKLSQPQKLALVTQAAANMQEEQQQELERLQALAKINPNIRQQEIDFMVASSEKMSGYIQSAQLKLDAVRVALVIE
jgi:ATP-dependent helicase HepA